jgi:hypothetical protein
MRRIIADVETRVEGLFGLLTLDPADGEPLSAVRQGRHPCPRASTAVAPLSNEHTQSYC